MGTPLEAPFRILVWLVIGIPVALLIWSVASAFIVAAPTVVAVQLGVFIAMVGYVVGIPSSISFRATKGPLAPVTALDSPARPQRTESGDSPKARWLDHSRPRRGVPAFLAIASRRRCAT